MPNFEPVYTECQACGEPYYKGLKSKYKYCTTCIKTYSRDELHEMESRKVNKEAEDYETLTDHVAYDN